MLFLTRIHQFKMSQCIRTNSGQADTEKAAANQKMAKFNQNFSWQQNIGCCFKTECLKCNSKQK